MFAYEPKKNPGWGVAHGAGSKRIAPEKAKKGRGQKPPQIALVNCYVDLPPLDEFDRTERVGCRP